MLGITTCSVLSKLRYLSAKYAVSPECLSTNCVENADNRICWIALNRRKKTSTHERKPGMRQNRMQAW